MTETPRVTHLTGAQVRAFIEGGYFLAHMDAVRSAGVEVSCRRCHGMARLTPLVGEQRLLVHCDCRRGEVRTDKPLELAPLLAALDWDLTCAYCGASLRGDNAQTASIFTVTCPCTTREYRCPVA